MDFFLDLCAQQYQLILCLVSSFLFVSNLNCCFESESTDLTPSDSSWIGAWWLGLFVVGILLVIASVPMMIFPRKLPPIKSKFSQESYSYYKEQQPQLSLVEKKRLLELDRETSGGQQDVDRSRDAKLAAILLHSSPTPPPSPPSSRQHSLSTETDQFTKIELHHQENGKCVDNAPKPLEEAPTLKGFREALGRLLRNRILLCRSASAVLHILPISGLYTFLPKYLENQFQITASEASMIAGLAGILVMGVGVFTSGIFMRKFNPSARFVAGWIAFAAFAYVLGMSVLMFLGCPSKSIAGINYNGWTMEGNQVNTR